MKDQEFGNTHTPSQAIINPRTLNEKIRFRMAHDRRPSLVSLSDKYVVRSFVTQRLGEQYLPKIHYVSDEVKRLKLRKLPDSFVIKTNHGCGGMILVSPKAPASNFIPESNYGTQWQSYVVNLNNLPKPKRLKSLLNYWLTQRYHDQGEHFEWAYQKIEPKIFIEEFIKPLDRELISPLDFKFLCFNGKVEIIKVISNRYKAGIRGDLYTPDWEHLQVEKTQPRSQYPLKRPDTLHEMISISEELSKGLDFVRVDLYNVAERIVFGEMTMYPEAGTAIFRPEEYDLKLGDLWTYFAQPDQKFFCQQCAA